MTQMEARMTWEEFAAKYCERQEQTPDGLAEVLRDRLQRFNPRGFVMLECQMMDGSRLGELTILPVGPANSIKEWPTHPISPRGLASDMAIAVAWMESGQVPA